MGRIGKRIENLERRFGDRRHPVEIRVVQEGPPGREHEAEYLYSIISEPSEGGGWRSARVFRPEPGTSEAPEDANHARGRERES
jgi:hypothetical protein